MYFILTEQKRLLLLVSFSKLKKILGSKIKFKQKLKDDQQYFPSEVESILRTFDNIAEANVFSIGNGKFDIYACAWIILKDKSKHTSVDEIKSFCNKEVKLLLNYIKFVDTFPTSANGKVFKSELSSLYKNELNLLI